MSNELRFDGRVAIVTGAGNGLGRAHALLLASRGAKVVVNDLGGSATGGGKSSAAADQVVAAIKAAGGEAVASYESVEDGAKIVECALDTFGRLDVVVNNAGILRDVSFQKMTQDDWDLVYRVHVLGSFRVTHAAWNRMRDQGYGRVVMTASAAGIYGNFGQANYSMAKLGLVGLAQTLALEGAKRNVHVNTIAPIAGSRLTETILPKDLLDALKPEYVSPLVAYLCHESCEDNGGLFEVGGGFFAKLRWERTEGATVRLGRAITPETVAQSWSRITDFTRTTHPGNVTESMGAVMSNVSAGPSKGGNDLIDVDLALGYTFPPLSSSYDERDLALYALAVGAGRDPTDTQDLRYVYELHGDGFTPLPTFAVVPALKVVMDQAKEGVTAPGMNYGVDRLLHGEQITELLAPLPPRAKLTHRARIKDIFDKGKNALVVTEIVSSDESGTPIIRNEFVAVIRGAGGWGGERGPSAEVNVPPNRAPDAVVEAPTTGGQALLYRLTGDWNPLHADPEFAKMFGFDRPILHGLCSFGFAGHAVLRQFAADPRLMKSIRVRFADSVFPGETLVTEMWRESPTRIVFRTKVKERDKVVISNAAVELHEKVPEKKVAPAAAAPRAAAAPVSGEPNSADVFGGIGAYLAKNAGLSAKVGMIYQFKLTAPESTWTVDLKAQPGKVEAGGAAKADCTLELSDADFMDMCTGKADPQQLYFGKKLKITGNIMASQKLEFLKKLEPELVMDAMRARLGAGGAAAAGAGGGGAAAPAGTAEPNSADVFGGIGAYLAKNAGLSAKVGMIYQFKLTAPESTWTVDLKAQPGKVDAGGAAKADCTLELSDADFMDMCTGKADPQQLYFGKKLKITGNIMASQKLEFLKKLEPELVMDAMKKRAGAGGTAAPAPASAASETPPASASAATAPRHAAGIFERLGQRLAQNPGLAAEVGAVVTFVVDGQAWTADLTRAPGTVTAGKGAATTTLTLSDDDLATLARGEETAQQIHQKGRLRVDGDVRVAHRLGLLKGLAG